MLRTTLIAALLTSTAAAVHAAGPDITPIEPVIIEPVAPFWEGGYVGGQLGWAYGEFDASELGDTFDDDSFIGGIHAGYLWEVGTGWYVGPEFQYDWADISVTDPDTGGVASFDEVARLKLMVGWEVGDGLIYGSGGVAYGQLGGVGDVFDGFDGDDTNYVVGLGYDHRVGDNWSIGGEYQFHHFNNIGAGGEDVDVNTLHFRASYRF
jgi:outer membrane immunogenic protein